MADWSIKLLEHRVLDGGVIVAHWECVDSETHGDETFTASGYGTCALTPDPSSEDFVAYEDLTEEMVLGWCWAEDLDQSLVELSLTSQIEEQKTPSIQNGLPWS